PSLEWEATRGVLSKTGQRRKSSSMIAASSVRNRSMPTLRTSFIIWSTLTKGTTFSFASVFILPPTREQPHSAGERRAIHHPLAHQAGNEIDEELGGLAALVEERIQLDDVEARHETAVMQHFHDLVRLAEGRAPRHRRADGR